MYSTRHTNNFKVPDTVKFTPKLFLGSQLDLMSASRVSPSIHMDGVSFQDTEHSTEQSLFKDFCRNTSIHGLRYLSRDGRPCGDRMLWFTLVCLAVIGTIYMSSMIWEMYSSSPTASMIESTNYPIENIPFPAITICDSSRIHWEKALHFQKKYLSGADMETIKNFHRFVQAMAKVAFGDFDFINETLSGHEKSLGGLSHINITQLMLETMPNCGEFFSGNCWWRNSFVNCCHIFEVQRTEYGFCYSFNSEVSDYKMANKQVVVMNNDERRPRRTSGYGSWGGLRVNLNTFPDQIPPGASILPGIVVSVHSPDSFMSHVQTVTPGSTAEVSISATVTYTTNRVRYLSPSQRQCLYPEEGNIMSTGTYTHHNCYLECHRRYMIQYCGCSPYFYPSDDKIKSCDVEGFLCLSKYNLVFNHHKPQAKNIYFNDKVEGMICSCMNDCNRNIYTWDMSLIPNGAVAENSQIMMDFHFRGSSVFLFRTDVVFGWLELLVAFGGIAGLFLGCSLLSIAELLYFLTIRLYRHWKISK